MQAPNHLEQETITSASTAKRQNEVPVSATRGLLPGKLDHTDLQSVKGFSNKQRAHLLKGTLSIALLLLSYMLS